MDYADWVGLIPSALSAVASIAAAVAAWGSFQVSRDSKRVAEQGALAVHHGSASKALTDALERVSDEADEFSSFATELWSRWAREIEKYDCRDMGGSNPRPLRHVLTNGSEMLERHATKDGTDYRHSHRSIFSVIRNGMGETSEEEYQELLKAADGTYGSFETVFGNPQINKEISSSRAFRWAYYQLIYRVKDDQWREIWLNAWTDGGWLRRYRAKFEQVEPVLQNALNTLKAEKAKLKHSAIPLDINHSLNLKYNRAVGTLEGLLEAGDLDLYEGYIDSPFSEDVVPLVLYSMAVALLAGSAIDTLVHEI